MDIYRAPVIQAIHSFYGELLYPKKRQMILEHLSLISEALYQGLSQKVDCLFTQLNNYNPNFIGQSIEQLKSREYNLTECQYTIAREYGFEEWNDIQKLKRTTYNIEFEHCVEAIITGDLNNLRSILTSSPTLISQQSQYGHKASLIHYTASNGMELWRQQVPQNLVEIIGLLIEYGANKDAKMDVYGGQFTAYELYTSSVHPKHAAIPVIAEELLKP